MSREEVEAVLGHEISHVANGDMVTLTLIQGVVNTFVVFLSRVVGFVRRPHDLSHRARHRPGYFITVIVAQIVLGVLASMIVAWFSRRREFRADAGSARLLGTPQPMMHALARLGGLPPGELPKSLTASASPIKPGFMALFATHPPIEERIARCRRARRAPDLRELKRWRTDEIQDRSRGRQTASGATSAATDGEVLTFDPRKRGPRRACRALSGGGADGALRRRQAHARHPHPRRRRRLAEARGAEVRPSAARNARTSAPHADDRGGAHKLTAGHREAMAGRMIGPRVPACRAAACRPMWPI